MVTGLHSPCVDSWLCEACLRNTGNPELGSFWLILDLPSLKSCGSWHQQGSYATLEILFFAWQLKEAPSGRFRQAP
jgi:hypothetical protein